MLVTLEGVMGSGKSLSACTFAKLDYERGREIISNNKYNFPCTEFNTEYFVDHMTDGQMQNVTMVLDEAYLYLDSRSSAAKLTKLFTYFVAQTRKRGVDLYICVHHIDTVDKRLRRAVDVRGTCRYRKEDPCKDCQGEGIDSKHGLVCNRCKGYGVGGYVTVSFFDMRSGKRSKLKIDGPTFWGNYDTRELVAPTGKSLNINREDL